ncbi:hypothetical protein MHM89_17795 [Pseudoalteromonas sp. CNC9-20]|uniref:hypothetical protein n=1 Tax=Pseudoalteromonas sp. CNC9-20 TaxID=2917750 RepID=UPI001EF6F65D|nr:hypothetical protein [Pseudoalteromonas sp. CNC9-20]MCG7571757.1 hypothetical protein [Pseudoalteromonas sp. CNC9-20]
MMKYVKLATLAVAMCSASVYAQQQCQANAQVLKANYIQQQGVQEEQLFSLWRLHDQVAHQANSQGVVELWQRLSNQQVRPIRYFEHYQRGIEYQPGELKEGGQPVSWSQKYQLVHSDLLSQSPSRTQGEGCGQEQHFEHQQNGYKMTLVWLPALQLVKQLVVAREDADHQDRWQQISRLTLQSYQLNPQQVQQQFAHWDRYQTTDYADVGDNEHDPFLAKMINQGFIEHGASGFYHSDGQAMSGGHHH